jgi:hypothetical protein
MVRAGAIDRADLKLLLLTDSPDEAMDHIRRYAVEKYHLEKPRPRASAVLGEKGRKVLVADSSRQDIQ